MNKRILLLALIAVIVFTIIIFFINMTIKKYGTESVTIKTPTVQTGTPLPSGEKKETPIEEPEREPVQTKGPLLY